MEERRENTRLLLEFDVILKNLDGSIHQGRSKDISFGGLFAEFPDVSEFKDGDQYNLSIIFQEGKAGRTGLN